MKYLMNDNGDMFSFSAHKKPVFKETRQIDWVLWGYSTDYEDTQWNNRQPDYYEWLYDSSSKHRAIINRKLLFINGKGLATKDRGLNLQEQTTLRAFTFKINDSEIIKKLTANYLKQGGFCYEVVTSNNKGKIEPHYINFKDVRRSKVEYDSNGREESPIYYYTSDWSCRKPQDNPDFTTFEEWKWDETVVEKSKRYLVWYSDTDTLYPLPEYTASVPYIAADYEISNFVYNNTKNGFSAGWLVNFYNGEPQEDQKAQIAAYWKSRLHGSDNAGEPTLSFNEDKDSGVEVTPLSPNGQDDRFINLNKQIREEIFAGHTVDPVVVGLEGNNGFNNNADEKRTAIEDFQNYYVTGKQQVLEQHLNAIKSFNEIRGEVFIQRLDPIKIQFTETTLQAIYTVDELREMDGAEPLTDEQKTTITKTTEKRFEADTSDDDKIIYHLATSGIFNDTYEVIKSRELFAKDIEDAEAQEHKFLEAIEVVILRMLSGNPSMPLQTIADASGTSLTEIEKLVGQLKEQGLIGEDNAVDKVPSEDEIFIVYKYELATGFTGDIISTTRDFCKNLVRLSSVMSWTLQDIRNMNNGMNLDVFRSRGGWYTKPGTDTHVPRCRHVWKQFIVRKKK